MSKAFSFDFAADDDDDDEDDVVQEGECIEQHRIRPPKNLDIVPPQVHLLQDVLSTFPSHLVFGVTSVPAEEDDDGRRPRIEIPRRTLYDIRAQLMAEEDGTPHGGESVVAGLSAADDIVPNVYEGGFKTWECSVDLSDYVYSDVDVHHGKRSQNMKKDLMVIELGAGTALPTLTLLHKWLCEQRRESLLEKPAAAAAPNLQICLADYNRSVLELATIPNLYLVTQLSDHRPIISGEGTDIIDSGPENLERFLRKLPHLGIDVSVISGSWTADFASLIPPIAPSSCSATTVPHETVVLASETIYSPASIRIFTQVLLDILKRVENQGSKARALVAAKCVYFGVGGGTDEFLQVLDELGGRGSIVCERRGMGVGRVIVEVTLTPVG